MLRSTLSVINYYSYIYVFNHNYILAIHAKFDMKEYSLSPFSV